MKKCFDILRMKVRNIKLYEYFLYVVLLFLVCLNSFRPVTTEIIITYENSEKIVGDTAIAYINSGNGWSDEEGYKSIINSNATSTIGVKRYDSDFCVRIDPIATEQPFGLKGIEIQQWGETVKLWRGKDLLNIIDNSLCIDSVELDNGIIKVIPNNNDPELIMSSEFSETLLNTMGMENKMKWLFVALIIMAFTGRICFEFFPNGLASKYRKSILVCEILFAGVLCVAVGALTGVAINPWNVTMIIPLLSIYMWGFIIFKCINGNIKSAFMPMITICFIGLGMLLAGYLNLLWGARLVILCSGFILFGYYAIKNLEMLKLYSADTGIQYFFIMSFVIIMIYCYKDMNYHVWDEVSHWGPFYKNIFMTDALPMYSQYSMTHGSYPQLCSTIFYFFALGIKEFNEPSTYALVMIMISAGTSTLFYILPDKRRIIAMETGIIASTFLVFFPEIMAYSTIYIDSLIGVIGGGIIVLIYSLKEKVFNKECLIILTIVIVACAQIKTSGLPIVLLCCGFYFVYYLLMLDKINKTKLFMAIKFMVFMILAVICFYLLHNKLFVWAGGINATKTDSFFSIENVAQCYEDWKLNGENSFWSRMTRVFFQGLLIRKIGMFPYVGWMSIFIIAVVSLKKLKNADKRDRVIVSLLPVATVILLLAIYLGYMQRISERALLLASFERYMTPLLVGCVLILFTICEKYCFEIKNSKWNVVVLGAISILCGVCFIFNDTENYFSNEVTVNERNRYRIISAKLSECVGKDDVIYVISQGNIGNVPYLYMYELTSQCEVLDPTSRIVPVSISLDETIVSEESGTNEYTKITCDKFRQIVASKEVDYILVDYADDILREGFGDLFSDGIETGNDWDAKLYQVNDGTDKYDLIKLIYE